MRQIKYTELDDASIRNESYKKYTKEINNNLAEPYIDKYVFLEIIANIDIERHFKNTVQTYK